MIKDRYNHGYVSKRRANLLRVLSWPLAWLKPWLSAQDRFAQSCFQMEVERTVKMLHSEDKYNDPRSLVRHGFKNWSQFDEDGIIQEIFNRIGSDNQMFVEFGVGDGHETNTTNLLHNGWKGWWFEPVDTFYNNITNLYQAPISSGALEVLKEFITPDNINDVFQSAGVPKDLDLISIDIDGLDIYVWDALTSIKPRVVCIEYNAKFRPPLDWIADRTLPLGSQKSDHFGASLSALAKVGEAKGYRLVGCSITGVNAFFVRSDIPKIEDLFITEKGAEFHYEPARYHLGWRYRSGMDTGCFGFGTSKLLDSGS